MWNSQVPISTDILTDSSQLCHCFADSPTWLQLDRLPHRLNWRSHQWYTHPQLEGGLLSDLPRFAFRSLR